jgi:tryptophan synthase beta subunit
MLKSYAKIFKKSLQNRFQAEFDSLLKDYVGRPTPLYFAGAYLKNTIQKYTFKREDLCHTGAHKINNTIGKFYLPNVWVKPVLLPKLVLVNMVLRQQLLL